METNHDSAERSRSGGGARLLAGFEWAVSLALLVVCVYLSWVFRAHAGGYWRDEANSVQLASWPGVAENWRAVWLDAHPVGYALILKPFVLATGLDSIVWLRWLGFAMCLVIFGTLWAVCVDLNRRPPLLLFSLIVTNHYAIRFLSSLRPYGVVTWLLILLFWRWYRHVEAKEESRRWPWECALLSAIIVNCLYAAVVPVFVLGVGAAVVIWQRQGARGGRAPFVALGLGLATLVFYLPALAHARYWAPLPSYASPTLRPTIEAFQEVLETQGTPLRFVWWVLLIASMPGAIVLLRRAGTERLRGVFLLLAVVSLVGVSGLLYFGKTLTAAWYFVPALAVVVLAGEVALTSLLTRSTVARAVILCLPVVLGAFAMKAAVSLLRLRQTNMDMVAAKVNAEAKSGDLVIVANPLFGVSFNLYYRGKAPWETIPPLSDHRVHRFDLIREATGKRQVMETLLTKVRSTLRGGGTLYIVGEVKLTDPKPDPLRAFDYDVPLALWRNELALLLNDHAREGKIFQPEGDLPMMPLEHPPLVEVRGWG